MIGAVLVLRCTKKLLHAAGARGTTAAPEADPLDSWHAHLFHWERRKCVIVVNDRTLFPVLLFAVKKAELTDLPRAFTERFCSLLRERGVPDYIIDRLRVHCDVGHVTTTRDRSVMGSLNQFVFDLKWVVAKGHCTSPTLGTREVDDFLCRAASLRIPEFRVAEAMVDLFLARFGEEGRPGLEEARRLLLDPV